MLLAVCMRNKGQGGCILVSVLFLCHYEGERTVLEEDITSYNEMFFNKNISNIDKIVLTNN